MQGLNDGSEGFQLLENSQSSNLNDISSGDFCEESSKRSSSTPIEDIQPTSLETVILLSGECSCATERVSRKKTDKNNEKDISLRRESRCGCKAFMEIVPTKCGLWEIKKLNNSHSHTLLKSPNKKRKLRSHNKSHKEPSCKKLMDKFHSCGVGPTKISRIINSANGSATDVVTPQQCSDYLRIQRKNNIGKECMIVIQKNLERKARDSEFYYTIQLDDTQSCRSIFRCDARARKAYLTFSDVIVFDVTYKSNNFSMPFAPFTGVNHHRQSILFGCALLSDEEEDTFVWLFEQWLKCIPRAIITDQDPAICNAIARIFPHAHHRYFKWHLGLHEPEHLRSLQCAHPTFNEDYNKWAKKSRTIEESEEWWITLCDKYKPIFEEPLTESQRNMVKSWKWIKNMYEKRCHWVKAYLKNTFFAGMKSSQRSESMNSFFDGYVNSSTPLSEYPCLNLLSNMKKQLEVVVI